MDDTTKLILTTTHMATEGDTLGLPEAFQLTLSAQRQFLTTMLNQARAETNTEAIEAIYDFANTAYGLTLLDLFPELHNKHINNQTIEAAISAQDQFIRQAVEELKVTNPRRLRKQKKALAKVKSDLRAKIIENEMAKKQIHLDEVDDVSTANSENT